MTPGLPVPKPSASPSMARNVAWNYAGAVLEAVASILLIAYITRKITVPEYGLLLLAMSLGGLIFLLDLGLSSLLVPALVAAAKGTPNRVSELLSSAFVVLSSVGTLGFLVLSAVGRILPGPLGIPPQYFHAASQVFFLIGISMALEMATTAIELSYEAAERFDVLNQLQLVLVLLRVVGTWLLLSRGFGVVALAALQMALIAFRCTALFAGMQHWLPNARLNVRLFSRSALKPLLKFSAWAVLDDSAARLTSFVDSLMLSIFVSVSSVALFGIGDKLPAKLSDWVRKGAVVAFPALSGYHVGADQERLRKLYFSTQRLIFTGALPFVLLGGICARPIIRLWAGNAYLGAVPVMQWLLVCALSWSMEHSSGLLLYACGEVKTAARIASFASLANILFSLVLVFRYGAVGVAAGATIAHVLLNLFWYTPAACRAAGTRARDLAKHLFVRGGVLFTLLASELVILGVVWRKLSPPALLIAGVCGGIGYLVVWTFQVALPSRLRTDERLGSAQ